MAPYCPRERSTPGTLASWWHCPSRLRYGCSLPPKYPVSFRLLLQLWAPLPQPSEGTDSPTARLSGQCPGRPPCSKPRAPGARPLRWPLSLRLLPGRGAQPWGVGRAGQRPPPADWGFPKAGLCPVVMGHWGAEARLPILGRLRTREGLSHQPGPPRLRLHSALPLLTLRASRGPPAAPGQRLSRPNASGSTVGTLGVPARARPQACAAPWLGVSSGQLRAVARGRGRPGRSPGLWTPGHSRAGREAAVCRSSSLAP